ncbi:MAG: ABC transporter [Eubacteriaceae bacterium]|nr:ABC transporter [Eubacteriaceae bacterium]
MKNTFKKIMIIALCAVLALSFAACGGGKSGESDKKVYKIGICNYVPNASLDQIEENIVAALDEIASEKGVVFEYDRQNCNADANVLNQIIANFIANEVDLMIGIATPVALAMQAATEDVDIPVVFSAVSDPVGCGLTDDMNGSGTNITGTSDYLDTNSVFDLIFAMYPDIDKVGFLYDLGQDASTQAIADAKAYLAAKGVESVERTGTNVDEVMLAAEALVRDGVKVVFTPQDNTIMSAELSIYETFAEAGIAHFTGADSFALNGAFLGYGVDYANLGRMTGEMAADILLNEKDPGTVPVMTFDNGTATVNTEICEKIGVTYDDMAELFGPLCQEVKPIQTSESF